MKYSFASEDEDGDSLTYELISARHLDPFFNILNTPYLNGTSPTHPTIDCGFHFDQKTGIYKFVPTEKGVYAITVKVSEYRGDSLMAYNIREEQFNVYDTLNCFNASIKNISTTACPIATNHSTTYDSFGCYVDTVKNFDFTFCHQNNIVLDIQVSNPDSAQMTFKDYTGIGTITDLDVDKTQVIRNFRLTILNPKPGKYNCEMLFKGCFSNDVTTTFKINILANPKVERDSFFYCTAGDPVKISIKDIPLNSKVKWNHTKYIQSFNADSSIAIFKTAVDTSYILTYSIPGNTCPSCNYKDTIFVKNVPNFTYSIDKKNIHQCINVYTPIAISPALSGSPYTYQWSPSDGLYQPITLVPNAALSNPLIHPLSNKIYTVRMTSALGCNITDTINVTVVDSVPVNAIGYYKPIVCPCDTSSLTTQTSFNQCEPALYALHGISYISSTVSLPNASSPSVFHKLGNDAKYKILYKNFFLTAGGVAGKNLKSISFLSNVLDTLNIFNDIKIRVGCTYSDTINDQDSLYPFYEDFAYSFVKGWNEFVSNKNSYNIGYDANLLVEISYKNALGMSGPELMAYNTGYNCVNRDTMPGAYSRNTLSPFSDALPHMKCSIGTMPANTYTYTWLPSSIITNNSSANAFATLCNPTNIVLQTVNGICMNTDTVPISIDTTLKVIARKDTFICPNSPLKLTSQFLGQPLPSQSFSFKWTSFPKDSSLKDSFFQNPTVYPHQTTTYIVRMSGGLCFKYDTVIVSVGKQVMLNLQKTDPTCNTSNGKIKVIASGNTPYTYAWSSGEVIDSIINKSSGTFSVVVKTNENCSFYDTVLLNNINKTLTLASSQKDNGCFGDSAGSIKVTVTSGELGPFRYDWTPVNINRDSIYGLAEGNYSIAVYDTNSGCSGLKNISIAQPIILSNIASIKNARCFNSSDGSIVASVGGGTAPYIYSWNIPSIGNTNAAMNLPSGKYILTIRDSNLCAHIDTMEVLSPPLIQQSASIVPVGCFNAANGKISVNTTGGIPPYTYLWSNGSTTDSAVGLAAGTYYLTTRDSNLCMRLDTFSVTQPNALNILFTNTPARCYQTATGKSLSSATGGTPPYTFAWSNGSLVDSIQSVFSGNYSLTITDSNGCMATKNTLIAQAPEIQIVFDSIPPFCKNGNNGQLIAHVNDAVSPWTYVWNTLPAQTDSIANGLTAGNYSLTVTDANFCIRTATGRVPANTQGIKAIILEKNNTTCANRSDGSIRATGIDGKPPYAYAWSNGNMDSFLINAAPAVLYSLTITDMNGCSDSISATIQSPLKFEIDTLFKADISCPGLADGNIKALAKGGTADNSGLFQWSLDSINFQTNRIFSPLKAGKYILYAKDKNQCTTSKAFEIIEPEALNIIIQPKDTTVLLGEMVQLKVELYTASGILPPNLRYQWTPTDGLSCTKCLEPLVGIYRSETFTLEVKYLDQCIAKEYTKINIDNPYQVFIPNAFTPNGDGVNDTWLVYGKGVESLSMLVFNRWGEKVFESHQQSQGWDGYYHGEIAPAGVYTYAIEIIYFDKRVEKRRGSVTLLK